MISPPPPPPSRSPTSGLSATCNSHSDSYLIIRNDICTNPPPPKKIELGFCPLKPSGGNLIRLLFHSLYMQRSVGLFRGRVAELGGGGERILKRPPQCHISVYTNINIYIYIYVCIYIYSVDVCRTHLCDHRKAQEEEAGAADQGEERLVLPQVFGELVRHGGHDGLDGGELEWRRAAAGGKWDGGKCGERGEDKGKGQKFIWTESVSKTSFFFPRLIELIQI